MVAKYPGSAAAGNALLLKADLLWKEGKKESSTEVLKEFLKSHPEHTLHATTLLALGSKQMALGDKDGATQSFETLKKSYPDSELLPAADIYNADILWADGKTSEAKALLEGMLSRYPGKMTAFTNQVDERVKMIDAGLPQTEVDPPPAPKAPEIPGLPMPTIPGIPGLPGGPLSAPSLQTPSSQRLPPSPACPPRHQFPLLNRPRLPQSLLLLQRHPQFRHPLPPPRHRLLRPPRPHLPLLLRHRLLQFRHHSSLVSLLLYPGGRSGACRTGFFMVIPFFSPRPDRFSTIFGPVQAYQN